MEWAGGAELAYGPFFSSCHDPKPSQVCSPVPQHPHPTPKPAKAGLGLWDVSGFQPPL